MPRSVSSISEWLEGLRAVRRGGARLSYCVGSSTGPVVADSLSGSLYPSVSGILIEVIS